MTLFVFFPLLPNGLCRIVPDERERKGGLLLPLLEEVVTEVCLGFIIQNYTKSLNLLSKNIVYVQPLSKISSRLFIMVQVAVTMLCSARVKSEPSFNLEAVLFDL